VFFNILTFAETLTLLRTLINIINNFYQIALSVCDYWHFWGTLKYFEEEIWVLRNINWESLSLNLRTKNLIVDSGRKYSSLKNKLISVTTNAVMSSCGQVSVNGKVKVQCLLDHKKMLILYQYYLSEKVKLDLHYYKL